MTDDICILLVDDEETFRQSTADILREQGYVCDVAPDSSVAGEKIRKRDYSLLIADIKMPGNSDLEFISELSRTEAGLPIILVTGFPTLETATRAVGLPVWSYLVKPFEIENFLEHVRKALRYSLSYRMLRDTQGHLKDWTSQVRIIETTLERSADTGMQTPINAFLALTMSKIYGSLTDLKRLSESLAVSEGRSSPCHLLDCPRPAALRQAIRETVSVLESTRSSFKSRELAIMRQKLETLLVRDGEESG